MYFEIKDPYGVWDEVYRVIEKETKSRWIGSDKEFHYSISNEDVRNELKLMIYFYKRYRTT